MGDDLEKVLKERQMRREEERRQLVEDIKARTAKRTESRLGVIREEVLARMEHRKHDATNLAHETANKLSTHRGNSAHKGYDARADMAREAARNANAYGDAAFRLRQKKLSDSSRDGSDGR